ncbi:MAG: HEPN domain-containing protein [Deltaproteobacteria bacterium]|nr:HEPN domain-containing protein [Deltaproteobacteria bacterium]
MAKLSKEIQKWIDIAQEDLEVAKELLQSGRYLYATFFCQQATEKAFKAVIEKEQNQEPPYIHNLARLADLAGYQCDEIALENLEDLNLHYIKGRYMVEREKLPGNKKDFALKMIQFSGEVLAWSLQKIK